jgi:predicted anti-sigma-YlaC factor YlaD
MLTCKEASMLVSESLEHKLPFRRRMAVRMHLLMCSLCRTYRNQMLQLCGILKEAAKPEAPIEQHLPEDARERIKQVLKNEE